MVRAPVYSVAILELHFLCYLLLSHRKDEHLQSLRIMAQVTEGLEVLQAINDVIVDAKNRPLQNTRIRHTLILDDPFPDRPQLDEHVPENSPPPPTTTEVQTPTLCPFPPLLAFPFTCWVIFQAR